MSKSLRKVVIVKKRSDTTVSQSDTFQNYIIAYSRLNVTYNVRWLFEKAKREQFQDQLLLFICMQDFRVIRKIVIVKKQSDTVVSQSDTFQKY